MSAAHQPQMQFARTALPPVAARYGRRGAGILLPRLSASTNHKPQMATHSKGWGVPLWNCCAFPPAARQGRAYLHAAAGSIANVVSLDATLPRELGAGFGRRPFALSQYSRIGRANARLGSNLSLCDRTLQSIRQGRPSHFKISVRLAHEHEAKGVGNDQKPIGAYQNVDC